MKRYPPAESLNLLVGRFSVLGVSLLLSAWGATDHGLTQSITLDTMIFSPHYYTDLQKALAEADNVWYLDLSMQKLRTIPEDIGKLKNLKYLDLSFNLVTSLPAAIAHLPKLEVLKISGLYNMPHLPEFLYEMKHLRELHALDLRVPPEELQRLKEALPNTRVILTKEDLMKLQREKQK